MLNRFRYYELDLNKTSHSYFNLSENWLQPFTIFGHSRIE